MNHKLFHSTDFFYSVESRVNSFFSHFCENCLRKQSKMWKLSRKSWRNFLRKLTNVDVSGRFQQHVKQRDHLDDMRFGQNFGNIFVFLEIFSCLAHIYAKRLVFAKISYKYFFSKNYLLFQNLISLAKTEKARWFSRKNEFSDDFSRKRSFAISRK